MTTELGVHIDGREVYLLLPSNNQLLDYEVPEELIAEYNINPLNPFFDRKVRFVCANEREAEWLAGHLLALIHNLKNGKN